VAGNGSFVLHQVLTTDDVIFWSSNFESILDFHASSKVTLDFGENVIRFGAIPTWKIVPGRERSSMERSAIARRTRAARRKLAPHFPAWTHPYIDVLREPRHGMHATA